MIYQEWSQAAKRYADRLQWSTDLLKENRSLKAVGIDRGTKHVEVLSEFSRLNYLSLFKIKVEQLASIGRASSVKHLLLRATNLSDLSFLKAFPEIKCLDIWDCTQLTSLSGIDACSHLEALNLNSNLRLTDLSELKGFPNLQYLGVTGGMYKPLPLNNLEFLTPLVRLKELHLGNTRLLSDDIRPIAGLRGLKKLWIPATYSAMHLAFLAGALPRTECNFFRPYVTSIGGGVSLGSCSRCDRELVSLIGAGKRRNACLDCNKSLILEHVRQFDEYVEKGKQFAAIL